MHNQPEPSEDTRQHPSDHLEALDEMRAILLTCGVDAATRERFEGDIQDALADAVADVRELSAMVDAMLGDGIPENAWRELVALGREHLRGVPGAQVAMQARYQRFEETGR